MMVAVGSSSPVSKTPAPGSMSPTASGCVSKGIWSQEEHDRFLAAMKLYPKGPWKAIADHIATRSVRQVQTHAQKYQEKVSRRLRGLRKSKKKLVRPEHRIDDETMELCKLVDTAAQKLVAAASKAAPRSSIKLEPLKKKATVAVSKPSTPVTKAAAPVPTAKPTAAATRVTPASSMLGLTAEELADSDACAPAMDLEDLIKDIALEPLPLFDFGDELDLSLLSSSLAAPPVPTVSESLDFLIDYLSI
jgi:SHAQKYF class myb-like DNA-binding protein